MSTDSEIHLRTGEFYFGSGHTRVRTLLGTCVAIVIWHPRLRIGGMCHYMLPTRVGAHGASEPTGLYAEDVMRLFAKELAATGTTADEYVVKVFGGGRMFTAKDGERPSCPHESCTSHERAPCRDVACKNVRASRELLAGGGFKIAVADVGGSGSRQVVFDVWTGDVWVRRGEPLTVATPKTNLKTKVGMP